ncbi:MAG: hypothetical protein Q7S50_01520 [bacterium]|nr:hypothetical protein [bacterium]
MSKGSRVGLAVAVGLFVLLEIVLYKMQGISFTTTLLHGSSMPVVVFVCGCIIGMAWDYLGLLALRWWRYPPAERHPWLLIVLPLFWGIFMLVMQDAYAIARVMGLGEISALLVSTIILGIIMEGANLYTRSWIYLGSATSIPFLIFGWIVGLGFAYVIGFNAFILNPFGF